MMNIQALYNKFQESGKISTDTRQISAGSIFFALKGDKFNANTFAVQALEKGASYVVVDEKEYAVNLELYPQKNLPLCSYEKYLAWVLNHYIFRLAVLRLNKYYSRVLNID